MQHRGIGPEQAADKEHEHLPAAASQQPVQGQATIADKSPLQQPSASADISGRPSHAAAAAKLERSSSLKSASLRKPVQGVTAWRDALADQASTSNAATSGAALIEKVAAKHAAGSARIMEGTAESSTAWMSRQASAQPMQEEHFVQAERDRWQVETFSFTIA